VADSPWGRFRAAAWAGLLSLPDALDFVRFRAGHAACAEENPGAMLAIFLKLGTRAVEGPVCPTGGAIPSTKLPRADRVACAASTPTSGAAGGRMGGRASQSGGGRAFHSPFMRRRPGRLTAIWPRAHRRAPRADLFKRHREVYGDPGRFCPGRRKVRFCGRKTC
jgi:hypothetical protein